MYISFKSCTAAHFTLVESGLFAERLADTSAKSLSTVSGPFMVKNIDEKNIIATLIYFFLNLQNPLIFINRSEQISIRISRFPYINRPVNRWNNKLVI